MGRANEEKGENEMDERTLRIATNYCIPPEQIVRVERKECKYIGGGMTYVVTLLDGEQAWHGCGHPRCSQCEYASASGAVGDDAIRKYYQIWEEKIRSGDGDVPSYVRRFVTRSIKAQERVSRSEMLALSETANLWPARSRIRARKEKQNGIPRIFQTSTANARIRDQDLSELHATSDPFPG
jgi:hypothetical protein